MCFRLSDASSGSANDFLRVSKVSLEWFSEFIRPGYSESGMWKGSIWLLSVPFARCKREDSHLLDALNWHGTKRVDSKEGIPYWDRTTERFLDCVLGFVFAIMFIFL